MNIRTVTAVAVLVPLSFAANSWAAGPTMPAAGMTTQTVACPQTVSGVHIKRIHQYTVPGGWADYSAGSTGYSGVTLRVSSHYVSSDGRKLYCGYGVHSVGSSSEYRLVVIVRSAPGARKCSAASNHTFRCSLIRRELRR